VTLTSSQNPSKFGQSVTFTTTVAAGLTGQASPTGKVTFMSDSNVLGSVQLVNGTASFSTSSLTTGSHATTAVYNGDANYNSHSSPVLTQIVTQ